ncbi:CAP domain-containing protein, partial [Streptomyces sp. CPS1]
LAGGGLWYFGTGSGSGGGEPVADRGAHASPADLSTPSTVPASPSPSASKSEKPKKPGKTASATPTRKSTPTPHRSTPPPPAHTTAPRPPAPSGTVGQVVALVNQERAKAGCSPLTEDPRLDRAAQAHSDDMAARHFFDHVNPDGADPGQRITAAGYRWSAYGENIAMGQQTPASVMNSWMNSSGHRANILNCSFKNIGVGVHNGTGGPWWTQDFGTKM